MLFKKKSGEATTSESIKFDSCDSSTTSVETCQLVDTSAMSQNRSYSLGAGYISTSGRVSFHAAPPRSTCSAMSEEKQESAKEQKPKGTKSTLSSSAKKKLSKMLSAEKLLSPMRDTWSSASQLSDKLLRPVNFERVKSCYLRVADLQMNETSHSAASKHDEIVPNFHHASVRPPPGIEHDPNEMWVAIDTGEGSHAPIAPFALEALAKFGMKSAMEISMWTPDKKTDKLIKTGHCDAWYSHVWDKEGIVTLPSRGFPGEDEVMVWTGEFKHGHYGSDLPAVRAAGIINMSAKSLTDLLLDSERVKEYNNISLGRTELMVMPGNFEEDGPFGKSVTKVLKSESKPPFLHKVLQFISIIHAKELEDGSGYLLVTRAVTSEDQKVIDTSILRSEILMGVNVIKKVEGDDARCLMINVSHIRSPMIPMMIAKRLGLSAASSFFHDLRALC